MRFRTPYMLAALFLISSACFAQTTAAPKKPLLSPPATAEATINGKKVSIAYSQPSIRGRKIMGGLVPYGKVWRTGANAATTLTTETDVTIGGVSVPKGTYTLYSLPSEDGWKLIINKHTGQWGTEYDPAQDLARVDLKKEMLTAPVETFVISFEPKTEPTEIVLQWENTKLSVSISAK